MKGREALRSESHKQAAAHFKRCALKDSSKAECFRDLGIALQQLEKPEKKRARHCYFAYRGIAGDAPDMDDMCAHPACQEAGGWYAPTPDE